MTDLLKPEDDGCIRTDVNCTNCGKNFIAKLDLTIDGNHTICCPYCGHEHCRVIKAGVVTSDRWDSKVQKVKVKSESIWKSESQPIMTSTASAFIRQSWLRRLGQ